MIKTFTSWRITAIRRRHTVAVMFYRQFPFKFNARSSCTNEWTLFACSIRYKTQNITQRQASRLRLLFLFYDFGIIVYKKVKKVFLYYKRILQNLWYILSFLTRNIRNKSSTPEGYSKYEYCNKLRNELYFTIQISKSVKKCNILPNPPPSQIWRIFFFFF